MKHACDYGVWDAAQGVTAQLESFSSKPLQRRDASKRRRPEGLQPGRASAALRGLAREQPLPAPRALHPSRPGCNASRVSFC